MRDLDTVFKKLALSAFRSRFALGDKDRAYLEGPWRGHPVFVAQHATGTCCRSCLAKWHGIEDGRLLTGEEQEHVVDAIMRWLADSPR